MSQPSFFGRGREPALVIQSVAAVLTMLITFGMPGLNDTTAALITAFLTATAGLVTALRVRPMGPAVFTGFITAAAALASSYGWHLSQAQVGSITAAVAMLVTLWARGQISPTSDPRPVP